MIYPNIPIGSFVLIAISSLLILVGFANAQQFQGTVTNYGKEQCIALDHLRDSSAQYLSTDADREAKLCSVDFHSKGIGLCPKTWSTSPGTIVYDIQKSKYNGNPDAFQADYCPQQRTLRGKAEGVDRLASYKQSVNGQFSQRTSATFSQASLLYYHFARYFNTTVDVPVAVVRTMSAQEHLHRVATKGLATARGGMILAGWKVVNSAESNPSGYVPINEFYYSDPKEGLFYGSMLKGSGSRYGAEFNGNIAGKGYSQQYLFMQRTPAFLALANPNGILDAIKVAENESKKDPIVAKAIGSGVSNEQMMVWMKELSEICLLDYIFSQQDRPGNIDYVWVWYYLDKNEKLHSMHAGSQVSRSAMASIQVPQEVKNSSSHYLIQKTQINDNDAGGRKYTNFTKTFGLLEKLRHLNAATYQQLIRLAKDFQSKGPLYNDLHHTFYISDANSTLIVQNAIAAAQILQTACKAGTMRFDLNPESYFVTQKTEEARVNCTNP